VKPHKMKSTISVVTLLTLSAALLLFPGSAHAGTQLHTLVQFNYTDGAWPQGLVVDKSGNLYGSTFRGGQYGNGTVYELSQSAGVWTETILYSFTGGTDGYAPQGPITMDAQGNLYGTTYEGGTSYAGVVYKLTRNADGTWTQSVLYNFTGGADGGFPSNGVAFDPAGNIYGTAPNGGSSSCVLGCGVVFKLTPSSGGSWTYKTIYSLQATGGSQPSNQLLVRAGKLYGTTFYTGTGYNGVVFELKPNGSSWDYSVLHSFSGGADGTRAWGALVADQAGNLYGATTDGGTTNHGTVFELTPPVGGGTPWNETEIYTFTGASDGSSPFGVIMDKTGSLYGTTLWGGNNADCKGSGCGTIFKLTNQAGTWTDSTLFTFTGNLFEPSRLTLAPGKILYGTAGTNGMQPYGAIIRLQGFN